MASRRFFAYDPYDYYYTAPYHYPYPYYHHPHQHQQPAPARRTTTSGFFPVAADAEPAPAVRRAAAPNPAPRARSVSIPVHFVGSHPEPERKMAGMRAEAPVAWTAAAPAVVPTKRPPSAEAAAVRLQAAVRGFLARRSVRAVREVEREAEEIRKKLEREAEELRRGDARARIAVGEALMRLLLRLDAVRGAREYRRRVTRRVLALQDAVDALEPTTAPEPTTAAAAAKEIEGEPVAVEMAEESAVAQEVPDAAGHHSAENEDMAAAEMEVDGDRDDGEPAAAGETERASDGTSLDTGADSEGEWEMVTEEPAADASAAAAPEVPRQAAAGKEIRGAAEDGADARRLMEMVAALCERSAQQCAVIGALAERVDALERAVRRVEDAGRRGRRAKKLRKEGKGSNRSKCASAIED